MDEVEVEGKRLPLGDKGLHPSMGPFQIEFLRNQTKAFPDPENVGVNWKCIPVQAKQQKTMKGLGTNPLRFLSA
jgi:hypothetical protein